MEEMLKGITMYHKVNAESLDMLNNLIQENPLKIGDIIAIDEIGGRKSSYEEIKEIPEERIIRRGTNEGEFEYIIVKNNED